MRSFIHRLLDRKGGPVKRPNQRPRLQVEPLEHRLTPAWFLMTSNLLDATSAPIALTAQPPGPQVFTLEIDGTLHLASGSAEQEASFKLADVASLTLGPGEGQTSFKVAFDESTDLTLAGATESAEIKGESNDLTLAGATESAEIKGDALVSLKIEGAATVVSMKIDHAVSLKLGGAAAEGDVTTNWKLAQADSAGLPVVGVGFDEAASLTVNPATAEAGGGGAGKVIVADGWSTALTGPVTSLKIDGVTGLTLDDAPVMYKPDKVHVTPAAPSADAAAAPSLMLDETESFSLNFLTASVEYKDWFASAGGVTSLKIEGLLMLNDGATATATQVEHLQATGGVTSLTKTTDLTLTPNDPTNLASDTQDIEAAGSDITVTVPDTVDLNVAGMELTSHTDQTETGNVVSIIEGESLPSSPGPGPAG
jgi:hypothetical protein